MTDLAGREVVSEIVRLRLLGRYQQAGAAWARLNRGREDELQVRYRELLTAAYQEICASLEGAEAYVTYGNVDDPDELAHHLPAGRLRPRAGAHVPGAVNKLKIKDNTPTGRTRRRSSDSAAGTAPKPLPYEPNYPSRRVAARPGRFSLHDKAAARRSGLPEFMRPTRLARDAIRGDTG